MKRNPCEYIQWYRLPVIRKELARAIMKNFGLNQRETAIKLGITPSTVSQYLSKKRGNNKIIDDKISSEIILSAERIIKNGKDSVIIETFRICKILRSEGASKFH